MIFGEWEYDDLLNGQIIYKSGTPKHICPHGVPHLNFMQTAIKVDFLQKHKESKEEHDKKHKKESKRLSMRFTNGLVLYIAEHAN
jgi:hypothetical protein